MAMFPVNNMLQVMRVQRLLHTAGIAKVVGFDVVRHRGSHSGRYIDSQLGMLPSDVIVERQSAKSANPNKRRFIFSSSNGRLRRRIMAHF